MPCVKNYTTQHNIYAELGASCLCPNPILNSDGDTGEFFRVKNYRREFFARKPVGLNSQVLPSELTL